MTNLPELLSEDRTPSGKWANWHDRVAERLAGSSSPKIDRLVGVDSSWALLGWAEMTASRAVQTGDSSLLRLGIAAVALVDACGALDGRDVRVVGGLLRRACDLLGLAVEDEVQTASQLVVVGGRRHHLFEWLAAASPTSNTLHEEIGEGESFAFERKSHSIDVERLQARFGARPPGHRRD